MKIGFDMDKVLIDYPPFIPDRLIDRLYKKKSNGTLLYRIPTRPEQFLRKVSHIPILRPAIKENISFLKSLSKKDHKLYLISSRFGFLEEITEALVKRLAFDKIFDGIYFNYDNKQPHEFKSAIIEKLKIDMYVDDDFPLILYLAKHNKKAKFYWLNKSQNNRMLTRNITAVTQIADILPHT